MTDAPLPEQSRAWHTRERMLASAVDCLVELGYSDTSTTAILRRSGVSRGSLLHQFPSKDDLLVAAVKRLVLQRKTTLESARDLPEGPARRDRVIELLWGTFNEPQFTAAVELWVAARHNTALGANLAPNERELGEATKGALATMFGPVTSSHPDYPTFITLLMSSMRGVVLTYFFEPRDHRTDPHIAIWQDLARRYCA